MKYKIGHIEKFWDDSYKSFQYIRQSLTDQELKNWQSQGYDCVKNFTGLMYDSKNPMPSWINRFDNLFELKNQTYTFYKMSTLDIMPNHIDHYRTYISLFEAVPENVCRVLVMLEDWKSGHYLEVDGKAFVNWSAGDYVLWNYNCDHAASNIGIEDRYTLQITGESIL
jgi:hypothetical protein